MEKYFFIPINSLNLNNLLSSESISPPAYYEKRGYGFKRFEKLISNPFQNSFLAYSSIPSTQVHRSEREEYPIYLGVPDYFLQDFEKRMVNGHIIVQVDRPVYINSNECFFFVTSAAEKKKLIASTNRSLEVKHVNLYRSSFFSLQEYGINSFDWKESIIKDFSDFKTINTNALEDDQNYNKVKGLVYGYTCGSLMAQPKELIAARRYFQEFINSFSSLMNEMSTLTSGKNRSSTKKDHFDSQLQKLQYLKESIGMLFGGKEVDELNEAIISSFKVNEKTLHEWAGVCFENTRTSVLSIITSFIKEKQDELYAIDELLGSLLNDTRIFKKFSSKTKYASLEQKFNTCRQLVTKKIDVYQKVEITEKFFDDISIEINSASKAKSDLKEISQIENEYFDIIANELLSRVEMSTSDDIAQQRYDIISGVADSIKKKFLIEDSMELSYLRKLFKSLKTVGVGFKPSDIKNLALQSFACFIARYSELDKFQDFMEKNSVNNFSLGYAFWGAAYGYANVSKTLLSPLQQNKSALIVAQDFIQKLERGNSINSKTFKSYLDSIKYDEPINIKEWNISEERSKLEESVDKLDITSTYEDLLRASKKINKEKWIVELVACSFEILNMDIPEGPMFGKDYRVSEFKNLISNKATTMTGFGNAKIDDATKLFQQFLSRT